MLRKALSFLFLVALAVTIPAAAQPFQGVAPVSGWEDTIVTNVSADGRVLVGLVRSHSDDGVYLTLMKSQAFRWEDGTLTLLSALPGHTYSEAVDVSADGSVLVGTSCAGRGDGGGIDNLTCRGVRWSGASVTPLPFMDADVDEGEWHQAFAVSASGNVVAGYLVDHSGRGPTRWAGGPPASPLYGLQNEYPHAISDDGSVMAVARSIPHRSDIYGYGDTQLYRVVGQTVTQLPVGAQGGAVHDISGDGSVIVGSVVGSDMSNQPVQWGPSGLEELPLPDSAMYGGVATAVSADGSVVVGSYLVPGFDRRLAIWRSGEFADVEAELEARGIDLGGVRLNTPTGVSGDGTVLVGRAFGTDDVSSYRIELAGPDLRFEVSLRRRGADVDEHVQDEEDPEFRIGDTVLVEILVENTGYTRLEDIRLPDGRGTINVTSDPADALEFIAGEQETIDALEPGETGTLAYTYEAVLAAEIDVLVGEVTAVAVDPETGERTTYSESAFMCSIVGKGGTYRSDGTENSPCATGETTAGEIVVNSTGDAPLGVDDAGDPLEECDTGEAIVREGDEEAECTLRAAIEIANTAAEELAFIKFSIPLEDDGCDGGACTITIQKALDPVSRPAVIDGTSQPGYVPTDPNQPPHIVLQSGDSEEGAIRIAADDVTVQGLTIDGFDGPGIEIEANDAQVLRNHILNNRVGVLVASGSKSIIGREETPEGGGEPICAGNIISGNAEAGIEIKDSASDSQMRCNAIGLLPNISGSRPNETGIRIDNAASNHVGNNVIAGNTGVGIHIVGARAIENRISENTIGGFPELGNEGNQWGIVVESASGNEIGIAGSERPVYDLISGNRVGEVLIYSNDPSAPADGNVVYRSGIGVAPNLHITSEQQDANGDWGIVISGYASHNIIGSPEDGNVTPPPILIAGHREANVAVFTPTATANKVLSGIVGGGIGQFVVNGEDRSTSPFDDGEYGVLIEGAIGTEIGSIRPSEEGGSNLLVRNHRHTDILVRGTSRREMTPTGPVPVPETKGGSGTVIRGTVVYGDRNFFSVYLSGVRGGIVGPHVSILRLNRGIILSEVEETTITGVTFQGTEGAGGPDRFVVGTGIALSDSHNNQIGGEGEEEVNYFDALDTAINLSDSEKNRVQGNTFGAITKVEEGVHFGCGANDNIISANKFLTHRVGVRLIGKGSFGRECDSESGVPAGNIIEANLFEGVFTLPPGSSPPGELSGTAIEVTNAVGTRIGGATTSGASGGNTIRHHRRPVVVLNASPESDGTTILGNSIYDNVENGISIQENSEAFDPFSSPIATIASTRTNGAEVTVNGTVLSRPDQSLLVQYFRSNGCRGVDEGRDFLIHEIVRTGALGLAPLTATLAVDEGDGLTVTATDLASRRTSEFSLCYTQAREDQTYRTGFDAGAGGTVMNAAGVIARLGSSNKRGVTDTLYVTAYADQPLGGRFSGQAALASSESMILPRSALHRYWRIETAGPSGSVLLDVCLDASALSGADAMETVVIQRSRASGGFWIPHDTFLEMHDGTQYACVDDIIPSGDFGFGSGSEAVLAAPVLLFPENEATGVLSSTEFSWQAVSNAARYDVQIALDGGFASLVVDVAGHAGTTAAFDSLAGSRVHFWRVRGVTEGGVEGPWSAPFRFSSGKISVDVEDEHLIPDAFVLESNYPNPFNPRTTIGFSLPQGSTVRLVVYDILAREVARLFDGTLPAGRHEAVFDAAGLPSGIYFYRLDAGARTETRSMTLLK